MNACRFLIHRSMIACWKCMKIILLLFLYWGKVCWKIDQNTVQMCVCVCCAYLKMRQIRSSLSFHIQTMHNLNAYKLHLIGRNAHKMHETVESHCNLVILRYNVSLNLCSVERFLNYCLSRHSVLFFFCQDVI